MTLPTNPAEDRIVLTADIRECLYRLKNECEIEGLDARAGFDAWCSWANKLLGTTARCPMEAASRPAAGDAALADVERLLREYAGSCRLSGLALEQGRAGPTTDADEARTLAPVLSFFAAQAATIATLRAQLDTERREGEQARAEAKAAVPGIYIASKAVHGPRWRKLRDAGWPIISTWIDEAEAGRTEDWAGLWDRCSDEPARAAVTVLYRELGEELKGALVEVGAALSHGRKVIVVGLIEHTWTVHRNVSRAPNIDTALSLAHLISRLAAAPAQTVNDGGER